MLNGHGNCNCNRAVCTETVELFCKHPPNWIFPVPEQIVDSWLDLINSDGKLFGGNLGQIGWVAKKPRHALYGWLVDAPVDEFRYLDAVDFADLSDSAYLSHEL